MAVPMITISDDGGITNSLSQVISGTVNGISPGRTVLVYDNGAEQPVGTATVGIDGRWSAEVNLSFSDNSIVARVTDEVGCTFTSNSVDYQLEAVLSPPSNGSSVGTLSSADSGSSPIGRYHVRHADHPNSVFVFHSHPGQALITGFHLNGSDHDTIRLPKAEFASIANALHDLHTVDGNAVLTFDADNSVTVQGITAHQLKAHPSDFRLHD